MFTSLALVILVGLALSGICKRLHLPGIIGLLLTGVLLGPNCLNLLDPMILAISPELRQMALIIILLKAGLSFKFSDLRQVGRPAVMLSCVPASCEILAFFLFAPMLLGISHLEAALMGAVIGAVSPAVVVPRMVHLMETKRGTDKHIPQMMVAGASCDDIFVIVLFTTFLGMAQDGTADLSGLMNIPISVGLGVLLGAISGILLSIFFETAYARSHHIRNSMKIIIILGVSFMLVALENELEDIVSISGLLAVVTMAVTLNQKSIAAVSKRLSEKLGKLWLAAEVILFVLVGSAVDVSYTLAAGLPVVIMIFISLFFRGIGVSICLLGTNLTKQERLFCILSYIPKATVQAAIGSVPLYMGLPCGKIVLCVAVVAIIITAPLGAILIDATYKKLLHHGD